MIVEALWGQQIPNIRISLKFRIYRDLLLSGGRPVLPPLRPKEGAGAGEVWSCLSCQGWSFCLTSFLCSFLGILLFQDKQTDRCYAAKHIRIRKPEQKEKVKHSREKFVKKRRAQNELIFLVLQGGGGDQPAEEVFKSPHNPFHRGV